MYLLLIVMIASGCIERDEKEGINTIAQLKELFADPPSEFRSAPLWVWHDDITEEGIDFQMKEFKNAGMGAVFVHPRPGLLIEYLSDTWFHLFDYAVQKGRELDMYVWIYDENSYPSGFAGGHVPSQMPDSYRHGNGLSLEIQQQLNVVVSDTLAVVLEKTDIGFVDITNMAGQEMGREGTFYVFWKTYPVSSPWYGGFSYVDLLFEGVTEKFMEITMSRGYERNISDFGATVPGIFTDEPNLQQGMSPAALIRWTPDLWDAFELRWGYDLRPHLPSLLEETGSWKKVRHNYFSLLLELFINRWAKPWYRYTEDKGLIWTGHYWEHGWPEPTYGFDEPAFYLYHQMPGIDMLGNSLVKEGLGGQFGNDRAVRELLSAANQSGRVRTLSETYGGAGWELCFKEQKRLVDWQCVLGVNFVNQHLSYYSLNGVRKFDYPPSFSYHQPWWEHYHLMADYIGRLSMALSTGHQINHTLVLQPNTSAWIYFSRKQKNPAIDSIRDGFKNFVYRMEQMHLEYDLGSEYVLRELGSVAGNMMRVGQRDYSLVIIPAEMETINRSTYELLAEFLHNGGKVISFRDSVTLINGEPSWEVVGLMEEAGDNWVVASTLQDPVVQRLCYTQGFQIHDISKNGMTYHQRRMTDDGQVLLLVNSHPEQGAEVEITVEGKHVSYLDLVSGKVYSYPARYDKGGASFRVELAPAGSALFAISKRKLSEPPYEKATYTETVVERVGAPEVVRESDNVLKINYLDLTTARSELKDAYFMRVLNGLYHENGIEMGNPWQHKIQYRTNYLDMDTLFGSDSWFEVSYHFHIDPNLDNVAMQSIRAVVERPGLWDVSINGHPVTKTRGSYWVDKDFPEYAVGDYLRAGKNTLKLQAPRMHILSEVMPVYIVGDFLVAPLEKGFGIAGGEMVSLGSWKDLGLPFYSESVLYKQSYELEKKDGVAYKVRLNKWNGTVAEVLVNGRSAGLIAWQPYEQDVTDLLHDGINEISVRITGSLKNTFGFFYRDNTIWLHGPFQWTTAPESTPSASAYYLIDYGLMEPFMLVSCQ